MWKSLISRLRLSYQNPLQEADYWNFRTPLIKDFCLWILVFTGLLYVPLTCIYIINQLYIQTYLGAGLLAFAVIIFFIRSKVNKYLELISIFYLFSALAIYISSMTLIIKSQQPWEAFYMGFTFALMQRMLDQQASKFPLLLVLQAIFIIVKFVLIKVPDDALWMIVASLDVFQLLMNFKLERANRILFSQFYKSRFHLVRLKSCLAEHFPSKLAVLVDGISERYFVNNSFKNSFECSDFSQFKNSLHKLVIDKKSVDCQNRELGTLLGQFKPDIQENQPLTLSRVLELLSNMIKRSQTFKPISMQVSQYEQGDHKPSLYDHNVYRIHQTISQEEDYSSLVNSRMSFPLVNGNAESERKQKLEIPMRKISSYQEHNPESHNPKLILPENSSLKPSCNLIEDKSPKSFSSRKITWKATIFPLFWDNSEGIGVVLDDTHERTIEELEAADKNKDIMMATVSHELRTPLNGMLGMLEIVQERVKKLDTDPESQVLHYLDAFKTNSIFLLNIVNSILDFSRMKNNELTLDYGRVNIRGLLDKIKPLFDHVCKAKNLYLNIVIDKDVPEAIMTDINRLSQIVINLISNALKFTFNGGITIRVTLEQQQSPFRIRVSVEDTGVGIKKEDIKKLFQIFGRLEYHRKINTQGVGLGLILSNTLAKLLDPNNNMGIQVRSELGKGTAFSFTVENKPIIIPKADSEASINEQSEPLTVQNKMDSYRRDRKDRHYMKTPGLTKGFSLGISRNYQETIPKWCLLVDDNPFNLIVAEHIMEDMGYQVKTALNGKEAIDKVKEQEKSGNEFRVILMDWEMPIMNGYEATKVLIQMMKEGEVSECPIVAVTANSKNETQYKVYEDVGISGFVEKPLQKEKLNEALRKLHSKRGSLFV